MSVQASPPTALPAVRLHGVTKRYGDLVAVDAIDLEVPRGSIFGLIGPNGAGKSTTFAMIATLLRPTSGVVEVLGERPAATPVRCGARMGYMPDVLGVYDDMVVDEYLRFFAGAFGVPASAHEDTVESLLELVDLSGKRDSEVNSLSRGMKQRLSLARALVHDPDLLVLDEPASGLDPRARVELRLLLGQLQEMGKTIIISSHILAELGRDVQRDRDHGAGPAPRLRAAGGRSATAWAAAARSRPATPTAPSSSSTSTERWASRRSCAGWSRRVVS